MKFNSIYHHHHRPPARRGAYTAKHIVYLSARNHRVGFILLNYNSAKHSTAHEAQQQLRVYFVGYISIYFIFDITGRREIVLQFMEYLYSKYI